MSIAQTSERLDGDGRSLGTPPIDAAEAPAPGVRPIDCACWAKRRRLLISLGWCVLLYSILAVRDLPGDYAHPFCGPWGCLPPLQALAAVHGAWALVAITACRWAIRSLRPQALGRVGAALLALGGAGLAALVGREVAAFGPGEAFGFRPYALQRAVTAIVCQTDLPLIPLAAAGLACRIAGLGGAKPPRATAGPSGP